MSSPWAGSSSRTVSRCVTVRIHSLCVAGAQRRADARSRCERRFIRLLRSDDGGERRQTRAVSSTLDDATAMGGAKDEQRQIPNKLRRLPVSRERGLPEPYQDLDFPAYSTASYRIPASSSTEIRPWLTWSVSRSDSCTGAGVWGTSTLAGRTVSRGAAEERL